RRGFVAGGGVEGGGQLHAVFRLEAHPIGGVMGWAGEDVRGLGALREQDAGGGRGLARLERGLGGGRGRAVRLERTGVCRGQQQAGGGGGLVQVVGGDGRLLGLLAFALRVGRTLGLQETGGGRGLVQIVGGRGVGVLGAARLPGAAAGG